ncbi:MAG: FHA domain-containing protein, partial [Chloroflexi bacterium]|nr:FHA domain-containing protein [Chloroflexota bacterium]
DLTLEHQEISRRHARLSQVGDEIILTDLGSSNGTFVDGQPLVPNVPATLSAGKNFEIGGFLLIIQVPGYQAPRAVEDQAPQKREIFHLRYRFASGEWQTLVLPDGDTSIGRGEDNDLVFDDEETSRHHAVITLGQNKILLSDQGSTNGTLLDNMPLVPHQKLPVKIGQFIEIGLHTLYVEAPDIVGVMHSASGTMVMPGDAVSLRDMGAGAQAGEPKTMLDAELPTVQTAVRTMNLEGHEKVTLGRASDNQVVLNQPLVSRYHAILEKMGKRFVIKDLRSSNGIYVNEQKIEREAYLKDWDQIRIGPYVFVLSGQQLQGQIEEGIRIDAKNINQVVSGGLNLLKDISLTMDPNEFVALVGMSGAGKSTFMNAINGYWPASHGQVLVNGINLYDHYDMFRDDIGYVPQKDIVHAELTPEMALDYVAQLRMPPDTTSQERQAVVVDVLRDLDLTERKDIPISRLSGGQLKRVSIGVELLTKPRLFFLDEPTSGLDPGTEYDMMKLMRRLADQGRTIILITHATKNVMVCDKAIFLARGGNMAFYGAPEDALEYFDHYRTDRERREKDMEFDDIYRILNDDSRGAPEEWRERYLQSHIYANLMGWDSSQAGTQGIAAQQSGRIQTAKRRLSSLRQFLILSSRNLKIITQDKVSLVIMLALAPILGLMDFIWGTELFDPVNGDMELVLSQWYMLAIVALLAGSLCSVREIVKEADIYKRERAVNLRIFPYLMSKVWVGVVLAIYQAGVLMVFRILFVKPIIPSTQDYIAFYITLFLGSLSGYLIGLMVSAIAPNQNTSMILLITVLVPQFIFSGALLPIDAIPGGKSISAIMPSRWVYEGFIKSTHIGDKIMEDHCLAFPKSDRQYLPDVLKEDCACMGESIFSDCADFPGILSPDFYDDIAKEKLAMLEPEEPPQPTAYAYPTALPSLTPIFTPTPFASPTPLPTPADPRNMDAFMEDQRAQGREQQDAIMDQFEQYRLDSQDQGQEYADLMDVQGDVYADLRQEQADEYTEAMQEYGDDRADWVKNREKAINSAESLLGAMYDDYGYVFDGFIVTRWIALGIIMGGYLFIMLIFQKRKDVV